MPKQFSLRLMMAVVTVLCIGLGVWGIPAERQRRAVEAIRAAGGSVHYSEASETFLRRWLPQDVEEISLVGNRATDGTMAVVWPFSGPRADRTAIYVAFFRSAELNSPVNFISVGRHTVLLLAV